MANRVDLDALLVAQLIAHLESERGTTLIETMISVGLLLVSMAGLLWIAPMATQVTENQGHLEARTTEYAQDKMEQLLALSYGDVISNTVGSGTATGLKVGGGADPKSPVDGYVDWLSADGQSCGGGQTPPADSPTCKGGWFYERVWQVSCLAVSCTDNPPLGLKQLTVTSKAKTALGGALIPQSMVTAMKTSQF